MTTCTTRAAETWAHLIAEVDPMPVSIAADFATDDGSEPAEACAAVEAVAQSHLDAHPDDHRARRLLGEWLAWHGDERGEGYAALAACGRVPEEWLAAGQWYWLRVDPFNGIKHPEELPDRWFDQLPLPHQYGKDHYSKAWPYGEESNTRRAAEESAALAFARLPAERRAALLKGEM